MSQCENCQSSNLEIDEPPTWNAPFSQRKKITLYAKCLECGKRLQQERVFNDLDEYIEFTKKLESSFK